VKILTILGTRPEIIRLSRVIPLLDEAVGRANHILVHTNQNYDHNLSKVFFDELGLRAPDWNLNADGSFGQQLGIMFPAIEEALRDTKPDRLLVLGDTNTALAAIPAARAGIPVYHMEAGNRSFSLSSPEEVNRRLVDHCSTVHLPYTERSRQNLLREGIHPARILVTGNPIWEVLQHYRSQWERSDALSRLGLEPGRYFLVTLHRAENVDHLDRLWKFLYGLDEVQRAYKLPVIVSTHPHLRMSIRGSELSNSARLTNPDIRFLDPLSFFDFTRLHRAAFCALSDSGTVQEESCLLHVPSVTLRDQTERPEAVECGASVLSGADPERILQLVRQVTRPDRPISWTPPAEYLRLNVAETVVRVVTSHLERNP
jgi:UDP-N-acetylglucosamine 2-epimerase (non-hydrolysing)